MTIEPLREQHLGAAASLWRQQAEIFTERFPFLPEEWRDAREAEAFVESRLGNGLGIAVLSGRDLVGYMTCDMFEFHGEKTAFVPILAHAAVDDEERIDIYRTMYRRLSARFVERGCLNHMCTFFSHDALLQQYLYELGFGLYAVDAFQDADAVQPGGVPDIQGLRIRKADRRDVDAMSTLLRHFHAYYRDAPLFLRRDPETRDDIEACLTGDDRAVFVALADDAPIGLMNVVTAEGFDPITLVGSGTGCIEPLGAFVLDEHRGAGIGKALLDRVFAWCRGRGLRTVHVDFESANQHAIRFWPKHFDPLLYSVKRRINNDF